MGSENPSGADNQQETAFIGRILRDCTRGAEIVSLQFTLKEDDRG
jgi:hypothetical protein